MVEKRWRDDWREEKRDMVKRRNGEGGRGPSVGVPVLSNQIDRDSSSSLLLLLFLPLFSLPWSRDRRLTGSLTDSLPLLIMKS